MHSINSVAIATYYTVPIPIVMKSLDPSVETRRAEPETSKGIIANVALVRLRQDVDSCLGSKATDQGAAALETEQIFVRTGKVELEMVCKERLGGANPFNAGGVYRSPVVAGALEKLCTIRRHFRTWFRATSLVLEELRHLALDASENVWRLRPPWAWTTKP